jgi:hypothetical protein
MKFFRLDLLTLLISLFILSGCKKQDGVGLNPDQQLNGALLVDDNIVINTVKDDSIVTSSPTQTPLGYFKDPDIGTTESNAIMGLNLPLYAPYTLPTGTITIDSALLILRYADGFYGDSLTSKYKANVYQLDEIPLSSKVYYSNKTWNVKSTLLGTKTFSSRTHTGFKITDIVLAGPDTQRVVPPEVRIPISPAFINDILFNAPSAQLNSNTVFKNAVKGLYVTLDKTQQGAGGNFMLSLDSSAVSIYYHATNGTTIDTGLIALPINNHSAEIKHTYNTTVQALLDNQTATNNTFYIQGLGGLRSKISFPALASLAASTGGDIVINRAELVMTPAAGTIIPFQPQPRLRMYQLDIAGQRTLLQDANPVDHRFQGLSIFGGILSTTNDYHFIITAYIQDLMLGKTVDYGTYIEATDNDLTANTSYVASQPTGGRLVANGTVTNQSSASYPYRLKLNLIYTKVNK